MIGTFPVTSQRAFATSSCVIACACCVVCAVQYVKLVDFGLAKVVNLDDPEARSWTLCGKPEYLAPEMITSKGHSKEVDWWALGILIHEMLAGFPPFYDRDPFKIYQKILSTKLNTEDFPKHFEEHARDLIKKLLNHSKSNRIGSSKNGAEDIKKHKWYRGLNWAALYNKQLQPPLDGCTYVPVVHECTFTGNFKIYPMSSEDNGPMLDEERDSALFHNWEIIDRPSADDRSRSTAHRA